jgi:hypothetical protein
VAATVLVKRLTANLACVPVATLTPGARAGPADCPASSVLAAKVDIVYRAQLINLRTVFHHIAFRIWMLRVAAGASTDACWQASHLATEGRLQLVTDNPLTPDPYTGMMKEIYSGCAACSVGGNAFFINIGAAAEPPLAVASVRCTASYSAGC